MLDPYINMPNEQLANQLKGLVGNTALLNAAADRLGLDEQPVYHSLAPMLRLVVDILHDNQEPDDLDALELEEHLTATLNFLDSRDTTVRETY